MYVVVVVCCGKDCTWRYIYIYIYIYHGKLQLALYILQLALYIPFCSHIQSDEAVTPLEGSDVSATDELQAKVSELEAKVKDRERKVADLFMDNVALKSKLKASREVEKLQQEKITSLKERLVQALRAQVNMHYCHCYITHHPISSYYLPHLLLHLTVRVPIPS